MSDAATSTASEAKSRFSYPAHPDELSRDAPVAQMPLAGDFVVFSIDPVASVAHLGTAARQAARRLPRTRHVGLVMTSRGLAVCDKPTNSFQLSVLRRGLPPSAPPRSFADLCIPILPNTYHPTSCAPLVSEQPLPWDDCYISATAELNFCDFRVTTAPRDYTPVLSVNPDQLWRLGHLIEHSAIVEGRRILGLQEGSLEAIASIPVPESPSLAASLPSSIIEAEQKTASICSRVSSYVDSAQFDMEDADSVSMTENVLQVRMGILDILEARLGNSYQDDMNFLDEFNRIIGNTSRVDELVIDVWYDLELVPEIPDTSVFLEECAQIKQIIEEGEEALHVQKAAFLARMALRAAKAQAAESDAQVMHQKKRLFGVLSKMLKRTVRSILCRPPAP